MSICIRTWPIESRKIAERFRHKHAARNKVAESFKKFMVVSSIMEGKNLIGKILICNKGYISLDITCLSRAGVEAENTPRLQIDRINNTFPVIIRHTSLLDLFINNDCCRSIQNGFQLLVQSYVACIKILWCATLVLQQS